MRKDELSQELTGLNSCPLCTVDTLYTCTQSAPGRAGGGRNRAGPVSRVSCVRDSMG